MIPTTVPLKCNVTLTCTAVTSRHARSVSQLVLAIRQMCIGYAHNYAQELNSRVTMSESKSESQS